MQLFKSLKHLESPHLCTRSFPKSISAVSMCSVKDLQTLEAVGELLQGGIESICNICMSLNNAHVDHNTGKCSNYEQIRKHIEHAEQCLKRSETMIKEKLKGLDECMEKLLKDKNHFEQEKKKKNLAMDKLHKNKACAEEMLHYSKAAFEQAEKSLASEKQALEKELARMKSCAQLGATGGALFLIPFVGLIAGPIVMYEGVRGMNEALNGTKAAEKEIDKATSQLRKHDSKVSYYQSRISEAQNEIKKTNEDLNKIQGEIEGLRQHIVVRADIQGRVREAVHLLSVLSGRATVLQKQTQHDITWEPMIKVVQDVMKAALNIAEIRPTFIRYRVEKKEREEGKGRKHYLEV